MLFSTQMWTPAACASLWTDVKQLQNRSHVAVVSAEPRLLYFWSIFIPKLTAAMSFLLQRRLTSCHLQDKWRNKINKIIISYKKQCWLPFPVISLQHKKKLSLFSEKSYQSQLISKESLAADVCYPGGCLSLPPGSLPVSKAGFRVRTLRDGCRRAGSALFQQAACLVGPRATCPLVWAHTSDSSQFRKCCQFCPDTHLVVDGKCSSTR